MKVFIWCLNFCVKATLKNIEFWDTETEEGTRGLYYNNQQIHPVEESYAIFIYLQIHPVEESYRTVLYTGYKYTL